MLFFHQIEMYLVSATEIYDSISQAFAFRDSHEKLKKAGAEVVGISGRLPSFVAQARYVFGGKATIVNLGT
ncbi:hypothetical protein LguiA_003085 [Lonicera macranthoides]